MVEGGTLPLDLLPDAHVILDARGGVLASNSRFDRRLLAEPRAFRTLAEVAVSPVDISADLEGGRVIYSAAWSACVWKGTPARLVRLIDVSPEREDLRSIEQSMQALEDVLDALPSSLLIVDESGRILSANARWHISARTNGLTLSRTGIGTNYLDVCDRSAALGSPDAEVVARGLRDVLARRLMAFETEYELTHGDEPTRQWYRLAISALQGQPGAVIQHTETTDSHREQQARIDALAHFKAVFEGAIDSIVIFDDELKVLSGNEAASQLFGRSSDALVSAPLPEMLYGEDIDRFRDQHRELLASGVTRGLIRLHRPDGGVLDVEYAARANVVPGRHVAVMRDMTSSRQLESQLRQAQKMEALGQLTGGIAHDFNNILTVVVAHADLLLGDADVVIGETAEGVAEILRAAQRGADMVRKLMAFARQEQLRVAPVQIDVVVAEVVGILRRVLPESIVITCHVSEDIPATLVDATAVQQILLNLATNARDAMAERGGELRLSVLVAAGGARTSGDHASADVEPMRHVTVSVSDSGTGMSSDTLNHLFEPFFTTKKLGEGTGLGMAMVYGLMDQMKGDVTVESRVGAGTDVHLHFPIAPGLPALVDRPARSPERSTRGVEEVLLVEDDEAIRRLAARVLRSHGYFVETAVDGESAAVAIRDRADASKGPYALVISDIVMPAGGGARVLAAVREYASETRMLWVTGYSGADLQSSDVRAPSNAPLVQKPWTAAEFLASVRAVLDAHGHVTSGSSTIDDYTRAS